MSITSKSMASKSMASKSMASKSGSSKSVPSGAVRDIERMNRRGFLAMLGSASALGVIGCSSGTGLQLAATSADGPNPTASTGATAATNAGRLAPNGERTLVVVELQGGNDGLAMLQPVGDGRLRGMRPDLMSADADLIDAGNGFGWHPNLAGIANVGIAGVVGIGSTTPDFSHFEMEQRWWRGDSSERSRLATGFFGRLCDQLDIGAPVTGLSLSPGPTPALLSDKAVTVGLTDPGANWFFQSDDPWLTTYGKGEPGRCHQLRRIGGAARTGRRGALSLDRPWPAAPLCI